MRHLNVNSLQFQTAFGSVYHNEYVYLDILKRSMLQRTIICRFSQQKFKGVHTLLMLFICR